MKAVGIICEYNPFHNGHMHQIAQAKEISGCDAVVCVMSGSVVQRGEIAAFDKWSRAKAALTHGADLVLELPAWYVLQSAETFARGGIEILKAANIIDAISFGSESADRDTLIKCSQILANDDTALKNRIENIMKNGTGYPAALQSAMDELYPKESSCLKNPNDMLGVSYITAMIKCGADFNIHPVKRHMAEHHSEDTDGVFASSTAIRKALENGGDISKLIPSELSSPHYSMKNIQSFVLGFYRTAAAERLSSIPGIEDGFENKLISSAKSASNLDEFYSSMVSKRYTLSRVKRTAMAGILGMEQSKAADYIRVLGMTDKGAALIKESKDKSELPFVVKTADFTPGENSTFHYDLLATDIAALACDDANLRTSGWDFYNSPVRV